MRKISITALMILLLFSTSKIFAQDDGQPPNFVPVPVTETFYEGAAIRLETIVNDQSPLSKVLFFYRFSPRDNFTSVPMELEVNYIGQIPTLDVVAGTLYYYFFAEDSYGNQATWPEGGERQPATLRVESMQRAVARMHPDVVIELLSPDPEEISEENLLPVILSIYDPNENIDLASIKLLLDKEDLTPNATITREIISFVPARPFRTGTNEIRIQFADRSGAFYEKPFEFTIGKAEKLAVAVGEKKNLAEAINLRVNLGLDSDYDKYSGKEQPDNRPIDTHRLNAKVSFNLGPVKFDASALLNTHLIDDNATELDKRRQPLNRLRIDMRSPLLDLSYGDYTPEFSYLTIKGTRVRGLSSQLKLGWWKTTYIQGETKQLIQSITHSNPDSSTWQLIKTENGDSIYVDHTRGTPRRKIQGLRTEMDFFRHFNVGFSGFKSYDDLASFDLPYSDLEEKYSILGNVVGGADATIHFNHDRTVFSGEIAFSAANDVLDGDSLLIDEGGFTPDNLTSIADFLGYQLTDDILFGSAEGRGVSVPLPDMDRVDDAGYLVNDYLLGDFVKNGTYRTEFRTPIPLKFTTIDFVSEYQRVPANYNSFANAAIRTDYQGLKTQARMRVWKNQVSLSGGLEDYHDNVAGDTRPQTTTSRTVSAGIGLNFSKLPTINYSIRSMLRSGALPAGITETEDGLVLNDNATITHTISPAYRFNIQKTSLNLSGNLMFMDYDDRNATEAQNSNFKTNSLTGALAVNFDSPLSLTLGIGRSVNAPEAVLQTETVFNLLSGKISYKFFDKKLSSFVGFNYVRGFKDMNGAFDSGEEFDDLNANTQWDDGEPFIDQVNIDNSKFTLKAGAQAKFAKNLSFSANLDQVIVKDYLNPEKDYNELRAKLRLSVWF